MMIRKRHLPQNDGLLVGISSLNFGDVNLSTKRFVINNFPVVHGEW